MRKNHHRQWYIGVLGALLVLSGCDRAERISEVTFYNTEEETTEVDILSTSETEETTEKPTQKETEKETKRNKKETTEEETSEEETTEEETTEEETTEEETEETEDEAALEEASRSQAIAESEAQSIEESLAASVAESVEQSRQESLAIAYSMSVSAAESLSVAQSIAESLFWQESLAQSIAESSFLADLEIQSIAEQQRIEASIAQSIAQSEYVAYSIAQSIEESASIEESIRQSSEEASRQAEAGEEATSAEETQPTTTAPPEPMVPGNFVLVGDSRTSEFFHYNFLPKEQCFYLGGSCLYMFDSLIVEAASMMPEKAMFLCGQNDMGVFRGDEKAFVVEYAKLINSFLGISPYTKVYVSNILPDSPEATAALAGRERIDYFNAAIADMCSRYGWIYVDTSSGFDQAFLAYDGIHFKYAWYPIWLANIRALMGV